MHHYGEAFTTAKVEGNSFKIQCTNHVTGAVVTLSGPVQGVFEASDEEVDLPFANNLARKLAHFLRENLMGGPKVSSSHGVG